METGRAGVFFVHWAKKREASDHRGPEHNREIKSRFLTEMLAELILWEMIDASGAYTGVLCEVRRPRSPQLCCPLEAMPCGRVS
jgi:hypothetical protein